METNSPWYMPLVDEVIPFYGIPESAGNSVSPRMRRHGGKIQTCLLHCGISSFFFLRQFLAAAERQEYHVLLSSPQCQAAVAITGTVSSSGAQVWSERIL